MTTLRLKRRRDDDRLAVQYDGINAEKNPLHKENNGMNLTGLVIDHAQISRLTMLQTVQQIPAVQ